MENLSIMSYRDLEIAPIVRELLPDNKVLLAERNRVLAGTSRKFFIVDKGFYHLSAPDFEDGFAAGEFLHRKVARCDFTHKKTSCVVLRYKNGHMGVQRLALRVDEDLYRAVKEGNLVRIVL